MTVGEPDRENGREGDVPVTPTPTPTPASGPTGDDTPLDVDSAFAAIVAGWSEDALNGGPTPWPDEENLGTPRHRQDGDDVEIIDDGPLVPAAVREETAQIPDDDPHDRFVPPEPPPLPRGDVISRLAWAGTLGGPLFLLIAVIAWRSAPPVLVLGAVAAFVAGFVALVIRMPQHKDDDGDDGAVV